MKIIDKYLIKNFLTPFLYCIITFFMISIVYDISINLDTFIQKKVSVTFLLSFYLLSLPVIAVNTMPIAALMATLYELGNFQRFNEITAFRASGLSNYRIIAPILICGMLISMLSFAIGELFVPESLCRLDQIESQKLKKGADKEAEIKIIAFYNAKAKRSWVGSIDPTTNRLSNFEIREFDNSGNAVKKTTAEKISYADNKWTFANGKTLLYAANTNFPSDESAFTEKTFDFPETPTDLLDSQKEAAYMNFLELYKHIKIHPKYSKIYMEEKVDFHYKFAAPLVSLIVVLIGIAFGMRTTRGGLLIGVGTSIAIFIAYYGLSIVALAMGKQEYMPAWLAAWLPNMFFFTMGVTFLAKLN